MSEYYKQRHLSPREKDDAIFTIVATVGTIFGLAALRKVRKSYESNTVVGRLLDDTQLSLDLDFDNELDFDAPIHQDPYDPEAHPDIEEAWQAFENRKRPVWERANHSMLDGYGLIVDQDTGDEYPEDTVFEVYKVPRYDSSAQLSLLHVIEGEDLEVASRVIQGDINKAKKFGYDLYIYENGNEIRYVPGTY